MYDKMNLRAVKAASTGKSRNNLNGLHVTPTETVATDGHILAIVKVDNNQGQPHVVTEPRTIPAAAANEALRAMKRAMKPADTFAYVTADAVSVVAMNAPAVPLATFAAPSPDRDFPQYQAIVKSAENTPVVYSIAFDVDLLARLADVAFEGKRDKRTFQLDIRGDYDPITVRAVTGEAADRFVGYIMPVRK